MAGRRVREVVNYCRSAPGVAVAVAVEVEEVVGVGWSCARGIRRMFFQPAVGLCLAAARARAHERWRRLPLRRAPAAEEEFGWLLAESDGYYSPAPVAISVEGQIEQHWRDSLTVSGVAKGGGRW